MPDALFSWEMLGTLAGAAAVTYLIVAYTKNFIDKFWPVGTDLYAVIIGFVVLLCASLATGQAFTWQLVALCLFNGFLVAATAGKMNDKAVDENEKKQSNEGQDA